MEPVRPIFDSIMGILNFSARGKIESLSVNGKCREDGVGLASVAEVPHSLRNLELTNNPQIFEFTVEEALRTALVAALPKEYIASLEKRSRDSGKGRVVFDELRTQKLLEDIRENQSRSLQSWTSHLLSQNFPTWVKDWVLKGVLGLRTNYDTREFTRRRSTTIGSFIEFNKEALDKTISYILQKQNGVIPVKRSDLDSFKEVYSKYLKEVLAPFRSHLEIIEGFWVKYSRGSSTERLLNDLAGKGTGWCVDKEADAKRYLGEGDLHIYYSHNGSRDYVVPRLAIYAKDGKIDEIRGIAHKQNLDPFIRPVLDIKRKEFPEADLYDRKTADMEWLSRIDRTVKEKGALTLEDLRFLYERDSQIQYFGQEPDSRIAELKAKLSLRKELMRVFKLSDSRELALRSDKLTRKTRVLWDKLALTDKTKLHEGMQIFGDVFYYSGRNIRLPNGLKIFGNVKLAAECIRELPEDLYIEGDLTVSNRTMELAPPKGLYVGGQVLEAIKSYGGRNNEAYISNFMAWEPFRKRLET